MNQCFTFQIKALYDYESFTNNLPINEIAYKTVSKPKRRSSLVHWAMREFCIIPKATKKIEFWNPESIHPRNNTQKTIDQIEETSRIPKSIIRIRRSNKSIKQLKETRHWNQKRKEEALTTIADQEELYEIIIIRPCPRWWSSHRSTQQDHDFRSKTTKSQALKPKKPISEFQKQLRNGRDDQK